MASVVFWNEFSSSEMNISNLKLDEETPFASYSPSMKSPVFESDLLIYDVILTENGEVWEGKHKYEIKSIKNLEGILTIQADFYSKNSTADDWGIPKNSDLTIGELSLNAVKIAPPYLVQHQYFFYEFKGSSDEETAKELLKTDFETRLNMSLDTEDQYRIDYFNPFLELKMSNATHNTNIGYEYYNGLMAQYNESTIEVASSNVTESYFELNHGESILQLENYNFWGDPLEYIPVYADVQIINTDRLIYSYSEDIGDAPEQILQQFTITSIDPDLQNRKTAIATTLEEFDDENAKWENAINEMIYVDHSSPFSLTNYQEDFLILPSNLRFNTENTIEELEATKYWLEEYHIWEEFDYEVQPQAYEIHLRSDSRNISVMASYGFDNILMSYELEEYTSSTRTKYINYELQYLDSKIKNWLDTPPASPSLSLRSSSITTNTSIQLSWTQPFFTTSTTLYMFRREGINSSLGHPEITQYFPALEGLSTTEMTFQGVQNYTYYFRVASVNPAGVESVLSNSVTIYISIEEKGTFPVWIIFLIVFICGGGVATFFMIRKMKKTKKKEDELDLSDFT